MRRHSKFPTIDTFNISVARSWEFSFSMFRYILPCNKRDCFKWWPIKLHSPLNFIQHSMCFCYCKKHLRYRISYHISHVDCKKSSSTIKKTKEPLNILLFFHQIKKINAQRKKAIVFVYNQQSVLENSSYFKYQFFIHNLVSW